MVDTRSMDINAELIRSGDTIAYLLDAIKIDERAQRVRFSPARALRLASKRESLEHHLRAFEQAHNRRHERDPRD